MIVIRGCRRRIVVLEAAPTVAVEFGVCSSVPGVNAMPIYISRGRFTTDAVKGMLAKPEDREEAVSKLFKSVGGRLIGWYLTFGQYDWMVIGEFPDEKAAATAILAAAAGGSLSHVETTVAMTAKEAAATFGSAGKIAKEFRSAGRA
jgi:uncharacterized protein with GYD domain